MPGISLSDSANGSGAIDPQMVLQGSAEHIRQAVGELTATLKGYPS